MIAGEMLQGRYRLVSRLGQGGMGAVYRAWDTRLGVPVALKEMVPQPGLDAQTLDQMREQFRQEAMVLARLNHPNLVNVTDFFEEGGKAYLVMRFIEGESLAGMITRQGPLPEAQVVGWARQLLGALVYCHGEGVLHRDIKPQNIIIRGDGQAILVDFGLVKLWNPDDPQTRTVMRGMGTPEYAPPEQYGTRNQTTGPRSDLYSLGATLYHALTGRLPPSASDRMATPERFETPRQIAEGVSPEVEAAVLRAMALPLEGRFGSADEMLAALPDKRRRADQPRKAERALPARVWLWALGGVAILMLGSGVVWAAGRALTRAASPVTTTPGATLETGVGAAGRTATATGVPMATPSPTSTSQVAIVTDAPATHTPTVPAATATAVPSSTSAAPPTLTLTAAVSPTPTSTAAASPTPTSSPSVAYERLAISGVANDSQGFASPPSGDLTLGGVPFSLSSRIFQSQAEPAPHNAKPTRARINTNLTQAQRVHLLLTTGNGFLTYSGRKVGEVIAICDGSPVVVSDLRLGQEVREWHSEPNVVATVTRAREVWTGQIAGTSVRGRLDLLSLDLPEACRAGTLEAIELVDTSSQTAGSLDPAFNLTGVTVELYR